MSAIVLIAGLLMSPTESNAMTTPSNANDREQVVSHIHGIFQAYLRRDRDTIRKTHRDDWVGFLGGSQQIERGIDAYMKHADQSMATFHGTGYELLDTEVRLYGDVAIVYYVASFDYRDNEGNTGTLPLRSVDIYRKDEHGWNQAGSHIGLIPARAGWRRPDDDGRATGPKRYTLRDGPKELLESREAVWRAWFANDRDQLAIAVPEDVIAIDPGVEEWADRNEVVRRAQQFADGGSKLVRLDFPKTEIQMFDDVAILYTTYVMETETDGNRSVTAGRGTEIFQRHGDRWINTGWHLDSGL